MGIKEMFQLMSLVSQHLHI